MMMVGEVEKFGVREARATKTAAAARSVEVPNSDALTLPDARNPFNN